MVHTDVLEWIKEPHPEIEVVICDPSCSGSGLNLHRERVIEECRQRCSLELKPLREVASVEYSKRVRRLS